MFLNARINGDFFILSFDKKPMFELFDMDIFILEPYAIPRTNTYQLSFELRKMIEYKEFWICIAGSRYHIDVFATNKSVLFDGKKYVEFKNINETLKTKIDYDLTKTEDILINTELMARQLIKLRIKELR